MDLTLTEDQRTIQATARDLLSSRATVAGVRAVAGDAAGYSTQLWKEMVELGWTGLALPEEYGGVGLGFLELCLVVEELGRARIPTPFVPSVVCGGMPILRHGTDAQRSEWLDAIVRGQVFSYVVDAEITAERSADGLVLDGTALFVPFADAADRLVVAASDGDDTIAVLVDTASPGLHRERLDAVGDPAHRVRFDHVSVAGDRVLGAGAAEAIGAYGIAATCAEMVGGAQGVLDMTVAYAREREQFGKPIGAFQAVQHHCANMAIDVLSARLAAYEAIWRLASGLDAEMELALAKAWVSEAYQRVCAWGHQVHGAIGFTAEHDLHHYFEHAFASALAFGDADRHTERVARKLGL